MKLISLKAFSPDGIRKLTVGEEFEISDKSALFLIATKRAKPASQSQKKKESVDHAGAYSRRDLRAEK